MYCRRTGLLKICEQFISAVVHWSIVGLSYFWINSENIRSRYGNSNIYWHYNNCHSLRAVLPDKHWAQFYALCGIYLLDKMDKQIIFFKSPKKLLLFKLWLQYAKVLIKQANLNWKSKSFLVIMGSDRRWAFLLKV